MVIEHVGLYVNDLEKARTFFQKYFFAKSNQLYHNEITGLKTYFLTFDNGTRLEIMHRPNLTSINQSFLQEGYHHLAFKLESKVAVDDLTKRLDNDGYKIISGPRITGDGYYETLFKFENYFIELVS